MSEPLPQPEEPKIICDSFKLIDEKVNTYVMTSDNQGIGTWQPGGGPSDVVDCKTFKLTTGPVNGYIMTSDTSGNGTWQAPPSTSVVDCKTFQLSTSPSYGYIMTSDASGNGSWQTPQLLTSRPAISLFKPNADYIYVSGPYAVGWTSIRFNTGTGLTINGSNIENNTPEIIIIYITFSVRWYQSPPILNMWINKKTSGGPLTNKYYGQLYISNNFPECAGVSDAVIVMNPGEVVNTVINLGGFTILGTTEAYAQPTCQIFRLN